MLYHPGGVRLFLGTAIAPRTPAPLPVLSLTDTPQMGDELRAAMLVVGTALGGGFLSLPHATSPAGWLPSSAALCVLSALLLCEAFIVADLVMDSDGSSTQPTISFATLAESAFGAGGGAVVSTVFVVLMMATLVAQVSRGAAMISAALPLPYAAAALTLAAALGAFSMAAPPAAIGSVNGVLASGLLGSTALLVGQGLPLAVWSRLGRAEWGACAASLPSLLQLIVYIEIVPVRPCFHLR